MWIAHVSYMDDQILQRHLQHEALILPPARCGPLTWLGWRRFTGVEGRRITTLHLHPSLWPSRAARLSAVSSSMSTRRIVPLAHERPHAALTPLASPLASPRAAPQRFVPSPFEAGVTFFDRASQQRSPAAERDRRMTWVTAPPSTRCSATSSPAGTQAPRITRYIASAPSATSARPHRRTRRTGSCRG
jgi:hypothetical protein